LSKQEVHLIGIGGMGMAPLALYLYRRGFDVRGHDDRKLRLKVKKCLDQAVVLNDRLSEDCDAVVYSSAVTDEHRLIREAKRRKLPLFRRGQYLAHILRDRKIIGVTGSHGKTSTTAWIIHLLRCENFGCDYVLGGFFAGSYPPAYYDPSSEYAVVEMDESDGTLAEFSPEHTVIVNDDWDHPAFYREPSDYVRALREVCRRTRKCSFLGDSIEWGVDVPNITTFGKRGKYSGRLADGYLCVGGKFPERRWPMRHVWVENVVGALSVVFTLTRRLPEAEAFRSFPGILRRQESLLRNRALSVTTDYAHHPTEIEYYLRWARECLPGKQWIVFEPHRYSRTQVFLEDFVRVLDTADKTTLFPIYGAHEENPERLSSEDIGRYLSNGADTSSLEPKCFLQSLGETPGPVHLHFVGAGRIENWGRRWLKGLKGEWKRELLRCVPLLRTEVELRRMSTMHVGGRALFVAIPTNESELSRLIVRCRALKLPCFVLGNGSNVLIPDVGFDGVVVALKHPNWRTLKLLSSTRFEVGCGLALKSCLDALRDASIGGFEFLEGIPGTIGGALKMNAGTSSESILDRLEILSVVGSDGCCRSLRREEISCCYRRCESLDDVVAVKATFVGDPSSPQTIRAQQLENRRQRLATQPVGHSLGCFFKNRDEMSTGQLLDELGLKGLRCGGAFVSTIHANFIVNDGSARFEDVVRLVRIIRRNVLEKRGLLLEPEVQILGQSWEEFL
jgi:UDP-N-acetylenolpyruvoylglucosamine reductase